MKRMSVDTYTAESPKKTKKPEIKVSNKKSQSRDILSKSADKTHLLASSSVDKKSTKERGIVPKLLSIIKQLRSENERLLEKVAEQEAFLAAAHDEIEERDKAILELANSLEQQNQHSDDLENKSYNV